MEQKPPSQIGPVIERRRVEADLTLRDLADLTGIPLATLHRRITHGGGFKVIELDAVATALGTSVTSLMAEAEQVAA